MLSECVSNTFLYPYAAVIYENLYAYVSGWYQKCGMDRCFPVYNIVCWAYCYTRFGESKVRVSSICVLTKNKMAFVLSANGHLYSFKMQYNA